MAGKVLTLAQQKGGAGNSSLRVCLLHAGDGAGQIVVVALGCGDQFIEFRGPESMPPIGRRPKGGRSAAAGGLVPLRGRGDIRPMVGGRHAAGGQERPYKTENAQGAGMPFHAATLALRPLNASGRIVKIR